MIDYTTPSKVSIAPMMDWTDRHCRYFMRLLSPNVRLYSEMVTAAAIYHGNKEELLRFDTSEHPLALQVGGSDPKLMAHAASCANELGYDEININVGCPSDRVQSGAFGACLMATPKVVADCYKAMQSVSDVPVTVKTRIGIDDNDSYEYLARFVDAVAAEGCTSFVVHARLAILDGLSPKENRTVPPLNYERVYRLKQEHANLRIILNGGIISVDQIDEHQQHVDGVMVGRKAYHEPYFLAELEQHYLSGADLPGRRVVVEQMLPYIRSELDQGERLGRITRHMLGLFTGQPGARGWRRYLSENAYQHGAGIDVLQRALELLPVAATA